MVHVAVPIYLEFDDVVGPVGPSEGGRGKMFGPRNPPGVQTRISFPSCVQPWRQRPPRRPTVGASASAEEGGDLALGIGQTKNPNQFHERGGGAQEAPGGVELYPRRPGRVNSTFTLKRMGREKWCWNCM